MAINKYQIAQSSYDNNNCVGKVIRDNSGNPIYETSTGHDIAQGLFSAAGTFGLPFANEIFSILDNIFCGSKCRLRRANRAKGIGMISNYKRPTVF